MLILLPLFFLALIAAGVLAGMMSWRVLAVYTAASVVAFAVYASDKRAARNGAWRTAESTLHLIALLGGWPGALLAQRLLRHKSSKHSFRIVSMGTVVLNSVMLFVFLATDFNR